MSAETKAVAIEQMLLGLTSRKPSPELVAGYCAVVADEHSYRVEQACARLLSAFTGRMVPAVLLAQCRKIEAEVQARQRWQGFREPEPPAGQRWLTPAECRERLEALRQHPEPAEHIAATLHRSMLGYYQRGAER